MSAALPVLRCPRCYMRVRVGGYGPTQWYECPHHGAVVPVERQTKREGRKSFWVRLSAMVRPRKKKTPL